MLILLKSGLIVISLTIIIEPELADRLKSRFAAGMIVDITEPEYESRLAILKVKLKEQGVELEQDILEYVASKLGLEIDEIVKLGDKTSEDYLKENPNLETKGYFAGAK